MSDLVERVRAALAEITPTDQDGWDMLALLAESADRIEQLEAWKESAGSIHGEGDER